MNNLKSQPQHFEVFLKFFEQNPEFATGKISSSGSRELFKKLWAELAQQLNSVGTFVKPVEKWQKTWADYKWGLKKKAVEMYRHMNETGGDLPMDYKLSTLEANIFKALGEHFQKSCETAAAEQTASEVIVKTEDISLDSSSHTSTQSKKRRLSSHGKTHQDFEEIYFIKEDEIVGLDEFGKKKSRLEHKDSEDDSEGEREFHMEGERDYLEIMKMKSDLARNSRDMRNDELDIRKRELALEERKMSFKEQKLKVQAEQHKQTTELLFKMAQIMENIVNKTHQKIDV